MGQNNHSYHEDFDEFDEDESSDVEERISVEQLRRLVQLLDKSDVSEVEISKDSGETRLVLRKAKASGTEANTTSSSSQTLVAPQQMLNGNSNVQMGIEVAPPAATTHKVVASLVGVFHVWAKPKGGALVAVGDKVKAGQLVGTIQSLNVINEVESQFAGRVVEILVQEGQPVEYGQHLMTIESAE